MRSVVAAASAGTFFALGATLCAVGQVSWRRTRAIREGLGTGRAPPGPISEATGPLTWLAAAAGVAGSAWGAAIVVTNAVARLGLLAGGVLITMSGFRARVTRIHADGRGLGIRYARGEPFHLEWQDLVALRRPITPVGGWRIQGRRASRTLMPSDLWSVERVLLFAVDAAGLRFDGRRWSAEPTRR
jgi:hypothetical protein